MPIIYFIYNNNIVICDVNNTNKTINNEYVRTCIVNLRRRRRRSANMRVCGALVAVTAQW